MLTNRPHLVLTLCLLAVSLVGIFVTGAVAEATASICPQSSTPFMVSGTGSTETPAAVSVAAPSGASTQATCVPPTFNYFTASPNPVAYGGSVTLSWSASSPYTLSCNVSSAVGGATGGATGSWTTGPITAQTYFELHCWDAYGDGNTTGVTVSVTGGGGGGSTSVSPTGWLDTLTSAGLVGGWACDGDSWSTSIYVHVYSDGAFVAQVAASVYRADVAAATWACNGTGNHGFTFQLPSYLLNGQPHTIQVYGINVDTGGGVVGSGNAELSGSPRVGTFTPPPPPPPTITSFGASPNALWGNGSTTLRWASSGSDSCAISSGPAGGSWSGLPASGSVTTPALAPNSYAYTLTCRNAGGSASAGTGVAVFSTDQNLLSTGGGGHQGVDPRTTDAATGCRWYAEKNWWTLKTVIGLVAGRLNTEVDWCVKGGRILKVTRTVWEDGPNYPASYWHFEGISSWGPCSEQCSDYVALHGTAQTQINIWVEGHWRECMSIPVVGSLCVADTFPIVGVLIKADGHRVDTYTR